jgi:ribonucleotide reductase beta subunit family protein with ferritin-like domain
VLICSYKLIEAENIISQFALDVQLAEARAFYSFQSMIEQVHSETYSLLIETYVRDQEEKNFLFRGMETSKSDLYSHPVELIEQYRVSERKRIGH